MCVWALWAAADWGCGGGEVDGGCADTPAEERWWERWVLVTIAS